MNRKLLKYAILLALANLVFALMGFISGIAFTIENGDISPTDDPNIFVFELYGHTWVYDYNIE